MTKTRKIKSERKNSKGNETPFCSSAAGGDDIPTCGNGFAVGGRDVTGDPPDGATDDAGSLDVDVPPGRIELTIAPSAEN